MNLYDIPLVLSAEELVTVITENKTVRIERIVSTGQTTDWYDQDESEFVALLQGTATLEFEKGVTQELSSGDALIIPPHKRHRVKFTSVEPPCVWLCVFWK